MAKPDSFVLGIASRPKSASPPPYQGDQAPDESADPLGSEAPDDEAAEGDITPDMLDYHGADSSCSSCRHFQAPTTCDRWPDPVEEGGWCKGWQAMGGGAGDMGDMGALADLGSKLGPGPGLPPPGRYGQ